MSKLVSSFAVLVAALSLAACQPSPESKKELEKFQALCKKHPTEPECTANAGGPN
jgi:ABC-type oligopeptide transport system substrate-binding subunit